MGMPDEHIHPTATGTALETVKRHESPEDLVFYSGWFCPFNARVWSALEERKIPYQYKEVNPYKKEGHFLKVNPKGLVPAIEYKGKALYESLVLLEWLEDAFPDTEPHIFSADPYQKARERLWTDHISKSIIGAFFRLLQAQEEDKRTEALGDLNKALKTYFAEVKGPFFAGEQWTLPDIALAPFLARGYILEEHRGYDPKKVSEGFAEYSERLIERPSVMATTSEMQYYEEIWGRYLRNEAQSEMAKATRSGRGEP